MALKRIFDLDDAAELTGTELVELEQGGSSVKCTTQEIADLAGGGGGRDVVVAAAISGGSVTLDCAGGVVRNFTIVMTENATLTVSNLAAAGRVTEFEVQITQDSTGSRSLTLPPSFRALGGSDTSISSAANSVSILSAKTFDTGATWRYAMQESA